MKLEDAIHNIKPPDLEAAAACRAHWNRIGKPLYGLGLFEEMLVKLAAVQRTEEVDIRKKALVIFCSDNGVVAEGVSQTGQEVTAIVAGNICEGRSCASIMCRKAGADLFPLDVGMAQDVPRIERRKCRCSTANIAEGPAMAREEAIFAIEAGIARAEELKEEGYRLLACGEMGIGNTTTGAAVASVLLDKAPELVTGRGAGLPDEGLSKKVEVIRRAVLVNRPDPKDPLDVLAKVGGFDIAAIAGFLIGAAAAGTAVVLDGAVTAAAALAAARMAPASAAYMLPSHMPEEPAAHYILEELGLMPAIYAGMHLGEGTGAAALFPLLDMSCGIYHEMGSFQEIGVEAYEDYTGGRGA